MLKRLFPLLILLLIPFIALAGPPRAGAGGGGADAMTQLLATMSSNTWAAVTTQGGQPSTDYSQFCFYNGLTDPNYPSGGAPDYNANVAADNQSSCQDNTGIYQGVAYDSNANRFLIGAGGGHSTGFENSIMEFSFSTLKWKRLTTPDDSYSSTGPNNGGSFTAVGGIDITSFPGVMTITSISSGKILIGANIAWSAWIGVSGYNTPAYVAAQTSGTTGGVGTYQIWWSETNTPTGGSGTAMGNTPGSNTNIPPGSTIVGVPSSNQTQAGQMWNAMLLNNSCPNNISGTVGQHDYGSFMWVNGLPDSQGSLLWAAIVAPWRFFTLNTINESNPLPSVANWQPPSQPTDASGLPTVSSCTPKSGWHLAAGPFGDSSWSWSNWKECTPFCGTGGWTGQIPGTTKIFQLGAGLRAGSIYELLYDASQDSGVTSTSIPPPYLSQDLGSRPPGPTGPSPQPFTVLNGTGSGSGPGCGPNSVVRGSSLWLLGDGSQNGYCTSGDYFGVRIYDMNTGNNISYTPNPSDSDNWALADSFTPYITYYPPSDVFIMLATTGHTGIRNTTAYGGISPGNIFDVVNPTPNGSNQISVSQFLVTSGLSMPTDLNCSGHSAGYGRKLQYDAVHNALVLLTCIGVGATPATVYVFKPGPGFP